ncbi:hypothetical protein [Paucibacter sp. TC2R-5]|uniref:hypothetical protein n=1 Tax=Paucibacter sp. TC2R-5 TaxID=2893555 RepID=UPI0039DF8E6B
MWQMFQSNFRAESMNDPDRLSVRRAFEDAGFSVRAWAIENGFESQVVYSVLSGRNLGRRGAGIRLLQPLV